MIEKIKFVCERYDLLNKFSEVIIFGSVVKKNKIPNDIDLLLVYDEYCNDMLMEKEKINQIFFEYFTLYVDITILSKVELEETKFLKKLKSNYIRIK